MPATIVKVEKPSWADRCGLRAGDKIEAVDGRPVRDLIDFSLAVAEQQFVLTVVRGDKRRRLLIRRRPGEPTGIGFASAVFDGIRRCANKCLFCFVDQMPDGLRDSLYIKDDDYRLSFLQGSFITLTNLGREDWQRIERLRLSPLYVSVHASDDTVRRQLLGVNYRTPVLAGLRRLAGAGIGLHCQVVLCPGLNDRQCLSRTITDLLTLGDKLLSLAVVPVGLTRYSRSLDQLVPLTREYAAGIIAHCRQLREQLNPKRWPVYLADEFYLKAAVNLPDSSSYDGFPQWENGVGIARTFVEEWRSGRTDEQGLMVAHGRCDLTGSTGECYVLCGELAHDLVKCMLSGEFPRVRVRPVTNRFFGSTVNVSGLLTGADILQWAAEENIPDGSTLILPAVAVSRDNHGFVDGMDVTGLAERLKTTVVIADGAAALRGYLAGRDCN
ncbi:MAG: DUF512 domain-containing protein [Negativicutes bacterium]|nr:DUF512 domain-containing protein [Negativicutes bacterium]